jgi:hypothetical protein
MLRILNSVAKHGRRLAQSNLMQQISLKYAEGDKYLSSAEC